MAFFVCFYLKSDKFQESESPWSNVVLDCNLIPHLSWLITENKGFCIQAIKWERSLKRGFVVPVILISLVALASILMLPSLVLLALCVWVNQSGEEPRKTSVASTSDQASMLQH